MWPGIRRNPIVTDPFSVNFSALRVKLFSTWASPFLYSVTGNSGSPSSTRSSTPGRRWRRSESATSRHKSRASNCVRSMSVRPDSMRARSSTSEMICSSRVLLRRMMSVYSRRVSCLLSSVSSSENPTMAFSGVRISWLMLARNADLSLLDSSARFFASRSSFSSVRLSSLMS